LIEILAKHQDGQALPTDTAERLPLALLAAVGEQLDRLR
jgi:hypothetical protein